MPPHFLDPYLPTLDKLHSDGERELVLIVAQKLRSAGCFGDLTVRDVMKILDERWIAMGA